jgi:hypothetical protein
MAKSLSIPVDEKHPNHDGLTPARHVVPNRVLPEAFPIEAPSSSVAIRPENAELLVTKENLNPVRRSADPPFPTAVEQRPNADFAYERKPSGSDGF